MICVPATAWGSGRCLVCVVATANITAKLMVCHLPLCGMAYAHTCWRLTVDLQHMLPNFNECWWDSWVLDVLVCNSFGE